MAKLTEAEKSQLRRPIPRAESGAEVRRLASLRDYLEFATFASRFSRASKPVRFGGKCWRL